MRVLKNDPLDKVEEGWEHTFKDQLKEVYKNDPPD